MKKNGTISHNFFHKFPHDNYEIIVYNGIRNLPATVPKKKQ